MVKFLRSRFDKQKEEKKGALQARGIGIQGTIRWCNLTSRSIRRWKNDKRNVFHPWKIYETGKWRLGSEEETVLAR